MNLNNQSLQEDPHSIEMEEKESLQSTNDQESTSATTSDIPEFGWSAYAERINGRFAMIGFISILLIEAFSQGSFLQWSGIANF